MGEVRRYRLRVITEKAVALIPGVDLRKVADISDVIFFRVPNTDHDVDHSGSAEALSRMLDDLPELAGKKAVLLVGDIEMLEVFEAEETEGE